MASDAAAADGAAAASVADPIASLSDDAAVRTSASASSKGHSAQADADDGEPFDDDPAPPDDGGFVGDIIDELDHNERNTAMRARKDALGSKTAILEYTGTSVVGDTVTGAKARQLTRKAVAEVLQGDADDVAVSSSSEGDEDSDNSDSDAWDSLDDDGHQWTAVICSQCNRPFRSSAMLERHTCKPQMRKDMVSSAIDLVVARFNNGEITNVTTRDDMTLDAVGVHEISLHLPVLHGWARRPKHGDTYGKRYTALFADKLAEFFQVGVQDSSRKMSPAQMLQGLEQAYPDRFDLPSAIDISARVSQMSKRLKEGKPVVGTSDARRGRQGMRNEYHNDLVTLFRSRNGVVRPREAVEFLKLRHEVVDDGTAAPSGFPTESQIKNKISSFGTAFRRNGTWPDRREVS